MLHYTGPLTAALCREETLKLLRRYYSEVDAETLSEKMRRKGILTHVSSRQSRALSSARTGAFTSEVWVVLSSQHEDAFALMRSKRHKVKCPLTEEEMSELERQAKVAVSQSLNRAGVWFLYALALAAIIAFGFAVFTGALRNAQDQV